MLAEVCVIEVRVIEEHGCAWLCMRMSVCVCVCVCECFLFLRVCIQKDAACTHSTAGLTCAIKLPSRRRLLWKECEAVSDVSQGFCLWT